MPNLPPFVLNRAPRARFIPRLLPLLALAALSHGFAQENTQDSAPPAASGQSENAQAEPLRDPSSQQRSWRNRRARFSPDALPGSDAAPGASTARHGMAEGETIPSIQFPNANIQSVLSFYERLTGKQVIYDNTVQGQVNIVVNGPVTQDEAVRILETAMMINGFNIVPGPGNIVKVLGLSKNPRETAVPILADLRDLPPGDQIVTFLFRLENADPNEVQQVLQQYLATRSYSSIIALPKSQALMVTETSGVIGSISQVIATLDRPPAEVVSEFISLQRADAADVVEKLNVIFEKPAQTTTSAPVPGGPPGAQGGQGGPGGPGGGPAAFLRSLAAAAAAGTPTEDAIVVGKIKLTADVRTNRIHVVTRPINIPFVRRLITEYDSEVDFGDPVKRLLRFVSAGDILDVVAEALVEPGSKDAPTNTQGNANNARTSRTSVTPTNTQSGSRTTGSTRTTGSSNEDELGVEAIDTTPESRTIGNTRIIADKRSNAIIVLGTTEAKEKVLRLLDQIDVRTPQVLLTAVIGELTLDDGQEFGIDYIQTLGRDNLVTNSDGSTVIPARSGYAAISNNTGVPIKDLGSLTGAAALAGMPSGYTGFFGITPSLELIVHALEKTGRFRITSRPMVFTSNNKRAIISSGERVAYPNNTTSGFTGSNNELTTTSTIAYQDVDLSLEVIPLINSDREVTLDIIQKNNTISGYTTISGNTVPNINARKINTSVTIANESTLVLGGLVQESQETSRSGVPILSKLPVVGPLFGSKKKAGKRTELVVLLRPTVTYGPEEAVIAGERANEKLNFPPDLDATLDPEGTLMNSNKQRVKTRKAAPAPALRTGRGF